MRRRRTEKLFQEPLLAVQHPKVLFEEPEKHQKSGMLPGIVVYDFMAQFHCFCRFCAMHSKKMHNGAATNIFVSWINSCAKQYASFFCFGSTLLPARRKCMKRAIEEVIWPDGSSFAQIKTEQFRWVFSPAANCQNIFRQGLHHDQEVIELTA